MKKKKKPYSVAIALEEKPAELVGEGVMEEKLEIQELCPKSHTDTKTNSKWIMG